MSRAAHMTIAIVLVLATATLGAKQGKSRKPQNKQNGATSQPADADQNGSSTRASTGQISLPEHHALVPSYDGKSMILLTGKTIKILDPHTLAVSKTTDLSRKYQAIAERDAYYVALSAATLDLLDKQTLAVTRSIPLRTSETYGLAIHPTQRVAFVTLFDDSGGTLKKGNAQRIAIVNETTGEVQKPANCPGHWIVIAPDGKRLFSSTKEIYEDGVQLAPGGDLMPKYGDIDRLYSYEISGTSLRSDKVNKQPGANGGPLRIAPDSASVSYISAAGVPTYAYNIPAFDPADVTQVLVSYSFKGHGFPGDIAYHPVLPLVAACSDQVVRLFDRATGDVVTDKVQIGKMKDPHHVHFSPDGRCLLIESGSDEHRVLRSYDLNLNDTEKKQIDAAEQTRKPSPSVPAVDINGRGARQST